MSPDTPPPTDLTPPLAIGAVERETRVSKDTLRVWERRYGFPQPLRDNGGERFYPVEQVRRIQHIRRLIDVGHRPGAIVGLSEQALLALADQRPLSGRRRRPAPSVVTAGDAETVTAALDGLQRHDVAGLRRTLAQAQLRLGLERFVIDVAAPLAQAVGSAWASGQLRIFEEHLCSEVLESCLRQAVLALAPGATASPRVLLTTPPGEAHRLGLLMAEALFVVEGCACMNLGTQTPLPDLLMAVQAHEADIVALSLTTAAPVAQVRNDLITLRGNLPPVVELWIGTRLQRLHQQGVEGGRLFDRLEQIGPQVRAWRTAQATAEPPGPSTGDLGPVVLKPGV